MGAELAIYDRIADPMAAVKFLGQAITKSGMFGVAGDKQGEVLAWECLARRQPPLTLAETYHVINGRLSMKADKMLANFNEAGGKHKIVARTAEQATIEMTLGNDTQTFSMSWEEAQQEPFVYNEKEKEAAQQLAAGNRTKLTIKTKYATPRARMQMLWARVISDGVRAMFPSANGGRYTPEEIDDDLPIPSDGKVAGEVSQGDVIDGEFSLSTAVAEDSERTGDEPALADQPAVAPFVEGSADGYATAAQSSRLTDLYASLGLSVEQIEKALKKRGASSNRGLKFEAAVELIGTLEGALANKQLTAPEVEQAAADVAGESRKSPSSDSHPAGPATPQQIEKAKALLQELNQVSPPQFNRYVAHMKTHGLKVADLSAAECEVLLGDLMTKQLAAFFDLSLQGWKPKEAATAVANEGDAKN